MGLRDDLRTALRSLGRRPAFAAVVVLTLAVTLGANTAVFSVLQQTVLRPLPYPAIDAGEGEVVYLVREAPAGNVRVSPMVEQVRAWSERAETVAELEGFDTDRLTLLERGEPRELRAAWVTPGLFGFLGVSPVVGPGFGDAELGDAGTVVLSDGLWRELYGGGEAQDRAGALGEPLRLGEETYTVAGVMGRGFRFVPPVRADLFLVMPETPKRPRSMITLARLAPGMTPEAAEEELLALERHRMEETGATGEVWRPRVRGLGHLFGADLVRRVAVLQGAVALMLLIACANVGNLFLIRTEGRSREIAVRSALGAGRGRVVRALLLESGILAGAGAVLGLAVAGAGGGLVAGLFGGTRVELETLRLDGGVFVFTAAAAAVAALAFGSVPAWTASRADLGTTLKSGGRGAGDGAGGRSGVRTRAALAVTEVALAVVLLVGAGLLTRSFVGLVSVDLGFEPDGLVTVSLRLPEERYAEEERQRAFVDELRSTLEASGVGRMALTTSVPTMSGLYFGRNLRIEGRGPLPEGLVDMVSFVAADPEYFRTLGVRFLEGGPFSERDARAGAGEERAIVVNRNLARVLWPEGNALGGRLKLGASEDEPWSRVVGVVGDVAQLGVASMHDTFQMYVPFRRAPRFAVMVRAEGVAPELVGERVAAAVHRVDPSLPVPRPRTAVELLDRSLSQERFAMTMMLAFAGVALALTVLGVYAVLAYSVRLRAFEIGVRSALGAGPVQVLGLVVRRGAMLVAAGLVLGTVGSLVLGRFVESQLHGIAPADPVVLVAAVGLLAATTTAAILVPARRAARLDPARVLRAE